MGASIRLRQPGSLAIQCPAGRGKWQGRYAPVGRHAQRLLRLLHRMLKRVHRADVEIEGVDAAPAAGVAQSAARAARRAARRSTQVVPALTHHAIAAVRGSGGIAAHGAAARCDRADVYLRAATRREGEERLRGQGWAAAPMTVVTGLAMHGWGCRWF